MLRTTASLLTKTPVAWPCTPVSRFPFSSLDPSQGTCFPPPIIKHLRFCLRSFHTWRSSWKTSSIHRAFSYHVCADEFQIQWIPSYLFGLKEIIARVLSLAIRHFQLNIWKMLKLDSFSPLSRLPQSNSFFPYYHHSGPLPHCIWIISIKLLLQRKSVPLDINRMES